MRNWRTHCSSKHDRIEYLDTPFIILFEMIQFKTKHCSYYYFERFWVFWFFYNDLSTLFLIYYS